MSRARPRWLPAATGAGAVIALLLLSVGTWARIGDWQDPERFWRTALAKSPGSEKVHINAAGIIWDRGQETGDETAMREADEILLAGIELRPESAVGYTRTHLHILLNLATHLRRRGRVEEAMPHYRRLIEALELFPDFEYDSRAVAYLDYGVALRDQGRDDEAIIVFTQASRLDPGWSLPYEHLAFLHARKGDHAAAADSLRMVISLAPGNATAQRDLGAFLHYLKRSEEALDPLMAAVRLGVPGAKGELGRAARAVLQSDPDHEAAKAALAASN